MIPMWIYVIVVAILIFGIYAFLAITGVQVRWLSRRSNKTAESIYGNYVDSDRKQQAKRRVRSGCAHATNPGQEAWHDGA
jgi:hypothetical protein